jgi:hypothetical protein
VEESETRETPGALMVMGEAPETEKRSHTHDIAMSIYCIVYDISARALSSVTFFQNQPESEMESLIDGCVSSDSFSGASGGFVTPRETLQSIGGHI